MTTFSLTDGADSFPAPSVDVSGHDSILGLGGKDSLKGGLGNDSVYGGDGDDSISGAWADYAETGADILDGGSGDDVLTALPKANGTADDTLFGGGGDDRFYGGRRIVAGGGDDSVMAGALAYADGGNGNDAIYVQMQAGVFGAVTLKGGDGTDRLDYIDQGSGVPGTDYAFDLSLDGQGGLMLSEADMVVQISGFETILLRTDADAAVLTGGGEQDLFIVSGDAARVSTGAGQDVVTVDYAQRFDGGVYDLDGGADFDVLTILAEAQNGAAIKINLANGTASIGAQGTSHFTGFEVLDLLGTSGADTVTGGTGADTLNGSFGADQLKGGQGDDVLIGGFDGDLLTGGGGRDQFVYASENDATASGADTIFGFQVSANGQNYIDRIDLSAVDAIHSTTVVEDFVFVGQAAFSAAGQVRVVADGGNTKVLVSTDSDATAEITIILDQVSVATIGAEDFIL